MDEEKFPKKQVIHRGYTKKDKFGKTTDTGNIEKCKEVDGIIYLFRSKKDQNPFAEIQKNDLWCWARASYQVVVIMVSDFSELRIFGV